MTDMEPIDRYRGCLLGLACGDADTTAAIVGQIAGAHYGINGIPVHWLIKIVMREDIDELARALFAR